jgi:hypothetical protein
MNCGADMGVPSGRQKLVTAHVLDGARLAVGEVDFDLCGARRRGGAAGRRLLAAGAVGAGATGSLRRVTETAGF